MRTFNIQVVITIAFAAVSGFKEVIRDRVSCTLFPIHNFGSSYDGHRKGVSYPAHFPAVRILVSQKENSPPVTMSAIATHMPFNNYTFTRTKRHKL